MCVRRYDRPAYSADPAARGPDVVYTYGMDAPTPRADEASESEPSITLRTEPGTIEDDLRGPLEEQLTSALQAAISRLTDEAKGLSVDEVYEKLRAGISDGLHPDIAARFSPNEAELRAIATQLSRGEIPAG